MNVYFTTLDFGDEAASLAAAEAGESLSEPSHIAGRIVLEHDGQPTISLADDLPFLVQSLCVDAPAALRASGAAEVGLTEWPNDLALRVEGDEVHLTGERGEDARYPRDAFLEAVEGCGRRFAAFLEAIATFAPDFEQRVEWLRAALPT